MLNYEEFKTALEKEVKSRLPIDYSQAEVRYEKVSKVGYDYDGMTFAFESDNKYTINPIINISSAYEEYLEGKSIAVLSDRLAEGYIEAKRTAPTIGFVENMFEFNNVRDRISARLINTEFNREFLETVPHKDVDDLSLVYTVVWSDTANMLSTTVITEKLMKTWGADLEAIHKEAMENISKREFLLADIAEITSGVPVRKQTIDDIDLSSALVPWYVLTTPTRHSGAVLATEPKIMNKITEQLGSVYVIPSSVDEVILVPEWAVPEPEKLLESVRDTNYEIVPLQDQLSDNIYMFEVGGKELQLVDIDGQNKSKDKDRGFDR